MARRTRSHGQNNGKGEERKGRRSLSSWREKSIEGIWKGSSFSKLIRCEWAGRANSLASGPRNWDRGAFSIRARGCKEKEDELTRLGAINDRVGACQALRQGKFHGKKKKKKTTKWKARRKTLEMISLG